MNIGIKSLTSRERRRYLFAGAVIFAAVAVGITYIRPLSDINYMVSDLFYESIVRDTHKEDSRIKIISIDEKTRRELGEYPDWSRDKLADMLEKLNGGDNAPSVIGVNLDLSEEKDDEGDARLVDTCKKYSNICVAGMADTGRSVMGDPQDQKSLPQPSPGGQSPGEPGSQGRMPETVNGEEVTGLRLPFASLLAEVSAGIVNANAIGSDGNVRGSFAGLEYGGKDYDSYSIAIYKKYLAVSGKKYQSPKIDRYSSFGINFALEKSEYSRYSFVDVLNGKQDASIFKNSIVLIENGSGQNMLQIPGKHREQMQENDLQAHFVEALLRGNTIIYVAEWFLAIWYASFAALYFVATSYESKIRTLVDSVLLIFVQVFLNGLLNYAGYYIPVLQIVLIVVLIAGYNLFSGYLISKWQKRNLEKVFKQYVDGQIVDEIVNGGSQAASIGVVRKDISVLFVDIRGFTSLSENLPPEYIVDILNNYLTIISDAVARNGGTLDKFIGDAAMAVFNSPSDLEDYVYKSVCTAWDILSNAAWLNELCQKKYGREVTFGIGIHCGDAVVGNIGSQSRMDYTAIGDTVNTSSRLESSADGGQILISQEVRERMGDRIYADYSGKYDLKGKKVAIDAYELRGIRDYTSVVEEPKEAGRLWKLPSLEELSKTLEELPKTLENLPNPLEELPNSLEELPKKLGNLSKLSEKSAVSPVGKGKK